MVRAGIRGRKEEHVEICARKKVSHRYRYWDNISLVHDALPEVDFDEIDLSVRILGKKLDAPIIIAAMTGGYPGAISINRNLAKAAEKTGIGLGLGSQRPALIHPELEKTYSVVRDFDVPLVLGNIGAPQLIGQKGKKPLGFDDLRKAQEMVGADAMAVHLNFLQEIAQWEGDTQARGCLGAIDDISRKMKLIVKETGAGISENVAGRLARTHICGIDIGGAGGTSFAAVEVYRARKKKEPVVERLGTTYWNWGIPAPVSVLETGKGAPGLPIIATGGVLGGLDVARALALGAAAAGLATRILPKALKSAEAVEQEIKLLKRELRAAMFLTGSGNLAGLARTRYVVTGECAHWLAQLRH